MAESGSRWTPLSALVRQAHAQTGKVPADTPLGTAGAVIAYATWGEATMRAPELVNIAALAWASRSRLVAHQVRPGAAGLVHAADLHSLPDRPPRLLAGPWLVEAHRPETGDRLFGDTVCLGGYPDGEGGCFLVGIGYPDGCRVARWRPRWTGGDLEEGTAQESSPLIADAEAHGEWAREAARFALVLGVLLDATGAPLRVEDDREPRRKGSPRSRADGAPEWTTRHVWLDDRRQKVSVAPSAGAVVEGDRLAEDVPVRGHLKRQRHGPGRAEVRWIWVDGYEARRWVSARPKRVVVH